MDPSEGFKIAIIPKERSFPRIIAIKLKDIAKKEARDAYNFYNAEKDLILWSDGSKLETGGVGAGITWKKNNT